LKSDFLASCWNYLTSQQYVWDGTSWSPGFNKNRAGRGIRQDITSSVKNVDTVTARPSGIKASESGQFDDSFKVLAGSSKSLKLENLLDLKDFDLSIYLGKAVTLHIEVAMMSHVGTPKPFDGFTLDVGEFLENAQVYATSVLETAPQLKRLVIGVIGKVKSTTKLRQIRWRSTVSFDRDAAAQEWVILTMTVVLMAARTVTQVDAWQPENGVELGPCSEEGFHLVQAPADRNA
jgi:hypothetical protein